MRESGSNPYSNSLNDECFARIRKSRCAHSRSCTDARGTPECIMINTFGRGAAKEIRTPLSSEAFPSSIYCNDGWIGHCLGSSSRCSGMRSPRTACSICRSQFDGILHMTSVMQNTRDCNATSRCRAWLNSDRKAPPWENLRVPSNDLIPARCRMLEDVE